MYSHFIGIFIHYNSFVSSLKTSNVLIDGQQRLTTIMLLLCASRDVTDHEALKKETENLNKPITSKKTESVIKNLPIKKCPRQDNYTGEFYQTF